MNKNAVGTKFETINFGTCVVVEYNNNKDVLVKFDRTGATVACRFDALRHGQVADRTQPTVYGVGIVGDMTTKKSGKIVPSYLAWKGIMQRGYGGHNRVAYAEVTVCDEWLTYKNFHDWYEMYHRTGYELDKDILKKGNKIYCPEYCRYVPSEINKVFIGHINKNKVLPVGVTYNKNSKSYAAAISIDDKVKNLGYTSTIEEAHDLYKVAKLDRIHSLANKYKAVIDCDVYDTLINWEV